MKRPAPLPTLPPNQCSHVVKYYEHMARNAPLALIPDGSIAPWILLDSRASAYALCMIMPSRFNLI
jgi:hypothetical protein